MLCKSIYTWTIFVLYFFFGCRILNIFFLLFLFSLLIFLLFFCDCLQSTALGVPDCISAFVCVWGEGWHGGGGERRVYRMTFLLHKLERVRGAYSPRTPLGRRVLTRHGCLCLFEGKRDSWAKWRKVSNGLLVASVEVCRETYLNAIGRLMMLVSFLFPSNLFSLRLFFCFFQPQTAIYWFLIFLHRRSYPRPPYFIQRE